MLRKIIFIFVAPCFGYATNEIFFQFISLFNPSGGVWLPGAVIPVIAGASVTAIFFYYGLKNEISNRLVNYFNTKFRLILLAMLGLASILITTEYKNRDANKLTQVTESESSSKAKVKNIFEKWTKQDSTNNIVRFGNSSEYKALSRKEKFLFFDSFVSKDPNYINANEATRKAIRNKFGID